MAEFLPGAPVAERLTQDLKARSDALRQRGVTPTLAIIRVGRDPGGLAYEKGAASRCAKCGIDLRRIALDDAASLPEVILKSFTLTAFPSLCGKEPFFTNRNFGVTRISSFSWRVMALLIFCSSM